MGDPVDIASASPGAPAPAAAPAPYGGGMNRAPAPTAKLTAKPEPGTYGGGAYGAGGGGGRYGAGSGGGGVKQRAEPGGNFIPIDALNP